MKIGLPPVLNLLRIRASGGQQRQQSKLGERGFIVTIPLLLLGVLGVFMFGAMATINWKLILAVMAMGIVAMAFVGVIFFKADFNLVILAAIVSLGIIFVVEVSLPVIAGVIVVAGTFWKLSPEKRPAMFVGLIGLGLLVMVWAYKGAILSGMTP